MMSAPIAPCPNCDDGDLYAPADPQLDVCESCLAVASPPSSAPMADLEVWG
jgi:hypothetical protein